MELSVCIPSIGRKNLADLVESIAVSDTEHRCEIVVADASAQGLGIASHIKNIKIVKNRQGSAAQGRNLCAQNAAGEYLAFVDDDCLITPGYISAVISAIQNNGDAAFAGMIVRMRNGSECDNAWLDAGFDRYLPLASRFPHLRWATTANLIMPRSSFLSTGGFDDLGIPVGGEDVEFGMRYTHAGYGPFIAKTDIAVLHTPIETNDPAPLLSKARLYGKSEQILARIFPDYRIEGGIEPKHAGLAKDLSDAFLEGQKSMTQEPMRLSLSRMANCYNNADGRLTFMMIKPLGMSYADDIKRRIRDAGFKILQEKQHRMTEREAVSLYNDVFTRILSMESRGSEFVDNHIRYLTSEDTIMLCCYHRKNPVTQESINNLRGHHFLGERCAPGTIRNVYRGSGVFNTFHCSGDRTETASQLKLFFPEYKEILA